LYLFGLQTSLQRESPQQHYCSQCQSNAQCQAPCSTCSKYRTCVCDKGYGTCDGRAPHSTSPMNLCYTPSKQFCCYSSFGYSGVCDNATADSCCMGLDWPACYSSKKQVCCGMSELTANLCTLPKICCGEFVLWKVPACYNPATEQCCCKQRGGLACPKAAKCNCTASPFHCVQD